MAMSDKGKIEKWHQPLTKRYSPVGKCIYCGATTYEQGKNRRLGDEHIIPEGLGGHLLLPEASCKECEAKTSAFEGFCLGRTFGAFRNFLGLPSKRLKDRPTTLPIRINATPENIRLGKVETLEVPVEMYPIMVAILGFRTPRIIRPDIPPGADKMHIHMLEEYPQIDVRLARIAERFGVSHVRLENMAVGNADVMRLMAKIAHGFLVAELGYDGFKPLLKDVILERTTSTSLSPSPEDYVGTVEKNDKTAEQSHEVKREIIDINGTNHHLVRIRLFPSYGFHEYVVVAGVEISNKNEVSPRSDDNPDLSPKADGKKITLGGQPKELLKLADGFYNTAEDMIKRLIKDKIIGNGTFQFERDKFHLIMPSLVLQSLAVEIYLKCLVYVDVGSAPRTHDLVELFESLSPGTQAELETVYKAHTQRDYYADNIRKVLVDARNAFITFSYAFEIAPNRRSSHCPWVGYCARQIIIKRNPDWAR